MAAYVIQVTSGQSSGVSASLSGGPVTIGRDPSSNLCVNDSQVSRFHAQLADNGREVVLRDLNSTNGTMVNGRRVTEAVIWPGDVINVGNSQLLLVEARQAAGHAAGGAYSQHRPPAVRPSRRARHPNRLEAAPNTYSIQVTAGRPHGASASFSGGSVTIGRDPSSDLCVDDVEASRFHARLTDNGREVVLSDLNSTNGTMVNGRRVTEAVIRPGDVINIGNSQILFAEARQAPRQAVGGAYSQRQSPEAARRRQMQAQAARRSRQDQYPQPRPAAASSTNWGGLLAAVLIIGVIGGVAYWFFFMSQKTDEEIAAEVAVEWTAQSIDEVAGQAMRVTTGTTFGSGFVADQIRQRVTWSYSEPDCPQAGRCDVMATARASSPFSISIPVLLDIDTGAKRVDRWEIQFGQASLAGIEGGDVIGSAAGAASDALDRLGSMVSDEDFDDEINEARDRLGNMFSDDDFDDEINEARDVAEEASDTIRGLFR